jgi:hypothetical protein
MVSERKREKSERSLQFSKAWEDVVAVSVSTPYRRLILSI